MMNTLKSWQNEYYYNNYYYYSGYKACQLNKCKH